MPEKSSTGIFTRIVRASRFSLQGLKAVFKREQAFRLEVYAFALLMPVAFLAGDSWFDTALLITSMLFVLIIEILNSAIEAVVDRIGEEYHPYSGVAKDAGSAAVMLSLLVMAIIWSAVLIGY